MKSEKNSTQEVNSSSSDKDANPGNFSRKGWIAPRSGLWVIAVASIACAAWTAWQVSQFKPLLDSILWGILFGATIWLAAGFTYAINRLIRRG